MERRIRVQDWPKVLWLAAKKYRERDRDDMGDETRVFLTKNGLSATGRSLFLYNLGGAASVFTVVGSLFLFWSGGTQEIAHKPLATSILETTAPFLALVAPFLIALRASPALALGLRIGLILYPVSYLPICLFARLNAAAQTWAGPPSKAERFDWTAYIGWSLSFLLLLGMRLYYAWPSLRGNTPSRLVLTPSQLAGQRHRLHVSIAVSGVCLLAMLLTAHGGLVVRYVLSLVR